MSVAEQVQINVRPVTEAEVDGYRRDGWAPENATPRSRWSYICNFFPHEAVYTGLPGRHTIGAEDELQAGQPFPAHPYYPTVYDPEG